MKKKEKEISSLPWIQIPETHEMLPHLVKNRLFSLEMVLLFLFYSLPFFFHLVQ